MTQFFFWNGVILMRKNKHISKEEKRLIKLEKKMQDFLIDNAPGGYFLPEKGVDFVTDEKNLTESYKKTLNGFM